LSGLGFQLPKRKYLPHLTVGRVRGGTDVTKLAERWLAQRFEEIILRVDQFVLFESKATKGGRIYKRIETIMAID
jgi:2'-5' RNA ligase